MMGFTNPFLAPALTVASLAFAACTTNAEEFDLPMRLTIDQQEVGDVRTGRDVRRALAQCRPPITCRYVGLEREPQIFYAAEFASEGYSITYRSGPPGPLWDASRDGPGPADHFTTAEMITITADYLDDRETSFAKWISRNLVSE